MKYWLCCSALTLATSIVPNELLAQESSRDFLKMSLEELTDLEVTSVSKKSEKASEAAAAIYVITQEDIRRSGATSIPEALRMAPGLNVARSGSHQWAISSRGFNDQFANKLLVLIDGRSVYTPLFSGVYWDVQDTLMEDIERIEVIRGPGATLWGANAVNGVINIITKKTEDTVGNLASASGGNDLEAYVGGRHGGKLGEKSHYRVYATHHNWDEAETLAGANAGDEWDKKQGGFRVDWRHSDRDSITIQGDAYHSNQDAALLVPTLTSPYVRAVAEGADARGANILGRWDHTYSKKSIVTAQAYLDYTDRDNFYLDQQIHTFDIDLQHIYDMGDRHEVIWGGGYRLMWDDQDGTEYLSYTPGTRSDNLFSAFVQDKIALWPETVFLTLGSKFERNDYTGFELQPSSRLSWLINDKQTVWASIARAVRTPNRTQEDVSFAQIASAGPLLVRLVGNEAVKSEVLTAYELGYRVQPVESVSLDFATFFNDYEKLASNRTGAIFAETGTIFPAHFTLPVAAANGSKGRSYGGEVAVNIAMTEIWKVSGAYSLLRLDLEGAGGSVTAVGKSPQQQFNIRSYLSLPHGWEWDSSLYYMDQLQPTATLFIPEYMRLDTRLGWKMNEQLEFSVAGMNLLDSEHREFSPFIYQSTSQIGRSVIASAKWRF